MTVRPIHPPAAAWAIRVLPLVAALAAIAGCSHANPEGFSETQLQGMDRQGRILKDAGGDWSKVSPDDKAFLIKGMGSEESARQYVQHAGSDGKAPAGQYGPPPGAGGPPPAAAAPK